MKNDARPDFDTAIEKFQDFLTGQGVSTNFLWLSKTRITQHKRVWWIFRPGDLHSDNASRKFYEELLPTASSIRIDGFPLDSDHTLAWVEDYGGPSGLLNFGLLTGEPEIRIVKNRIWWTVIWCCNWVRDIRYHSWAWNITPPTEQAGDLKPDHAPS